MPLNNAHFGGFLLNSIIMEIQNDRTFIRT